GCRAPLPWDASPSHGWGPNPWLPWAPEPERRNVDAQRDDPSSILHLYKRLLAARYASPALSEGEWAPIDAPDGVFAYARTHGDDRRIVAVNFTDRPMQWDAAGTVEVASNGVGEGVAFAGTLPPDGAVVLR